MCFIVNRISSAVSQEFTVDLQKPSDMLFPNLFGNMPRFFCREQMVFLLWWPHFKYKFFFSVTKDIEIGVIESTKKSVYKIKKPLNSELHRAIKSWRIFSSNVPGNKPYTERSFPWFPKWLIWYFNTGFLKRNNSHWIWLQWNSVLIINELLGINCIQTCVKQGK